MSDNSTSICGELNESLSRFFFLNKGLSYISSTAQIDRFRVLYRTSSLNIEPEAHLRVYRIIPRDQGDGPGFISYARQIKDMTNAMSKRTENSLPTALQ